MMRIHLSGMISGRSDYRHRCAAQHMSTHHTKSPRCSGLQALCATHQNQGCRGGDGTGGAHARRPPTAQVVAHLATELAASEAVVLSELGSTSDEPSARERVLYVQSRRPKSTIQGMKVVPSAVYAAGLRSI